MTSEEQARLEKMLLAAAFADKAVFYYLRGRLTGEEFASAVHRRLWQGLREGSLSEKELAKSGLGGFDGAAVAAGDVAPALRRLKAFAALRSLKKLCARVLGDLEKDVPDPQALLERFVRSLSAIAVPQDDSLVKMPDDWLDGGYAEVLARRDAGRPRFFDLGLGVLTEAVAAKPGHLVILAAETGKGKTAFALNVAANLGVCDGIPTFFFNTEMSWQELALRLYSLLADVSLFLLRTGRFSPDDLQKVDEVRQVYRAGNALYITDALPWVTVDEVAALAREYAVTAGLKVCVLDYIQRVEDRNADIEQWEAFLRAAKRLKSLAQELRLLVIVVAQLNERQQLAGSKGMAREADAVLVLEEAESPSAAVTHRVRLVKSRHTRSGTAVPLVMDRKSLRLYEALEDGPDGAGAEF